MLMVCLIVGGRQREGVTSGVTANLSRGQEGGTTVKMVNEGGSYG